MADGRGKPRVILWGPGQVGIGALRALIAHPGLELAGVVVHAEAKDGKDAGDLCGMPATGVIATRARTWPRSARRTPSISAAVTRAGARWAARDTPPHARPPRTRRAVARLDAPRRSRQMLRRARPPPRPPAGALTCDARPRRLTAQTMCRQKVTAATPVHR